jgi:transposase
MAYKRKDIMEIRQMILLKIQGKSNRQIAKLLGINRNTINNYIQLFKSKGKNLEELKDLEEEKLLVLINEESPPEVSKRQAELLAYFPQILKNKKRVGFTFKKMWEEYKAEYIEGYAYSQFMEYFHRWNIKNEATLKLTHQPGDSLMVDYAGKKLQWINKETGEVHDVEVFVGCLPASGYVYVHASASQKKEDFINSITKCLEYIGGVPKMIVPDNLKSAVSKASKYEGIANRSLRELGLYYGAVLNPTRPYKPKDKALVERMVRLVYEQIYFKISQEVFHSLHELNMRILELLEVLNDRPLSQLNCSRRELFLEIEKPALQALPPQAYMLKEFQRSKVQKTSHVYMSKDKNYYSVPYRYIGKHVQVQYTSQIVEIFYNHHRIAKHFRTNTIKAYTTKKEHLPSNHQFYLNWHPQLFMDKADEIGAYTGQYVKRLFEQSGHVETKYKSAMGIVQLNKKFEVSRIEKACQLAIMHPTSSYQRIATILDKQLDLNPDLFAEVDIKNTHIPNHENIRGEDYYLDLINQQNNNYESDNLKNEKHAIDPNGSHSPSAANG